MLLLIHIYFLSLSGLTHGLEKDKFIKIEYEELIAECKAIELVICE